MRVAAALLLSVCLTACAHAPARETQQAPLPVAAAASAAPPTTDGVYIVEGLCFGEGMCMDGPWRAPPNATLRASHDLSAPVVATLTAGEWVTPLAGQMRVAPQRGVVRIAHRAVDDDGAPMLEPGEVVYLLESEGEGFFAMWRQGSLISWRWPDAPADAPPFITWDEPIDGPTLGYWVRVRRANGQSGWAHDTYFECSNTLAGDDNCPAPSVR